MKKSILTLNLILFFFIAVSCKKENNCNTYVVNAKTNGRVIDISVKTDCDGLFVKFPKRYAFYVNLSNMVKNGAVPYGFSAIDFNKTKYISLGVDGHLKKVNMDGFVLYEDSKISLKDKEVTINFKIGIPKPVSNVIVESPCELKEIYFERFFDCKNTFLMLLKKPDAFNKKPEAYYIPKLQDFISIYMEQKSHVEKDKLLVSTFSVDEKILSKLEDNGKKKLAEFLRKKFFDNRKVEIPDKCHVKLIVLNSDFQPVKGKFTITLQKITKETFEKKLKNTSFDITSKGVYQVKVFYGKEYGTSRPFMCKGKYLFVIVVLTPVTPGVSYYFQIRRNYEKNIFLSTIFPNIFLCFCREEA